MPLRTQLLVVLCFALACVGGPVGAAAANKPPNADHVQQIIADSLPGYWKVDQLSLSDPVDYGNPVEPEWRWRYEALIAPKEPLYVEGGRHEGAVLLELSLSPGSTQTLYGVAVATFQAGSWSGKARHENRPFDHGGQPASFFPGRTVVVGSPEERGLREANQKRELEKLKATLDAERAELKLKHQAALATAKEVHRATLDNLKADLERRQAEQQNELTIQLGALEASLKAKAEQRRVEIAESEKLTELTTEARDRLAALQAAEAERFAAANGRLTALQGEEAEMLAASERFLEARRVALKKLFDRLGALTGPDDYLALLDTAGESQLDWMRVAALRHGLQSEEPALIRAALRHLLQADDKDSPDLQNLIAEYMEILKDSPDFAGILEKHDWIFVDLEPKSNTKLTGHVWYTGNRGDTTLSRLPIGRVAEFEGPDGRVKFSIIDGAIAVFGTNAKQWPKEVNGIVVDGRAKFIYFLHATAWANTSVPSYKFVMNYRDGKKEVLKLTARINSDDWCRDGRPLQDKNSVWGWVKKQGGPCGHAGLVTTKWENPHPDIWIDTIDIVSVGLNAVPIVSAITLGEATRGLR